MTSGQFNSYYYHRTTRKVIAAVAQMFANMQICQYSADGLTELNRITVPIVMGQKEKWLVRNTQDPNLTKSIEKSLPMMALEFLGMTYDPSRKQITTQYNRAVSTTEGNLKQPTGVPYDLSFRLSILVKNIEDGMQIVEQILPTFTPDYTIRIKIDPVMGIDKDFPVLLDSVNYEVMSEGSPNDMRVVSWELKLTVKGWYLPMTTDPAIIKTTITHIYSTTNVTALSTTLTMTPGGNTAFQDFEQVYQGNSLTFASATAVATSWEPTAMILYIDEIQGTFVPNANVIGANTNASWNVASISGSTTPMVNITITPNPFTANVTDNWTYHTVLNEYLNGA